MPENGTDDATDEGETDRLVGGVLDVLRDSMGWTGEIAHAEKCGPTWRRSGRPDPAVLQEVATPGLLPSEFFLLFAAQGSDLRGCGSKVGSLSYPLVKDMQRVNLHWNHSLFPEGNTHRVTVVFSDAHAVAVSPEDLGA